MKKLNQHFIVWREKYFNFVLFGFFLFLLANDLVIFKFSSLGKIKRSLIDSTYYHQSNNNYSNEEFYQQNDSLQVFQQIKIEIDNAVKLNYCSQVPRQIQGTRLKIEKLSANFSSTSNDFDVNSTYDYHSVNGRWLPLNCKARHRVAIIIPYKNRQFFNFYAYYLVDFWLLILFILKDKTI